MFVLRFICERHIVCNVLFANHYIRFCCHTFYSLPFYSVQCFVYTRTLRTYIIRCCFLSFFAVVIPFYVFYFLFLFIRFDGIKRREKTKKKIFFISSLLYWCRDEWLTVWMVCDADELWSLRWQWHCSIFVVNKMLARRKIYSYWNIYAKVQKTAHITSFGHTKEFNIYLLL